MTARTCPCGLSTSGDCARCERFCCARCGRWFPFAAGSADEGPGDQLCDSCAVGAWKVEWRPGERDFLITRSRESDPLVVLRPNTRTPDGRAQAEVFAKEVAACLDMLCAHFEALRELDDALKPPIESRAGAFGDVPTREGLRRSACRELVITTHAMAPVWPQVRR